MEGPMHPDQAQPRRTATVEDGLLVLRFPWDKTVNQEVKSLGWRWNWNRKAWTHEANDQNARTFLLRLAPRFDEIVPAIHALAAPPPEVIVPDPEPQGRLKIADT